MFIAAKENPIPCKAVDMCAIQTRLGCCDFQSIGSIIDSFRRWGDCDALVSFANDQTKKLSYRQLADNVDRLAIGFQKAGISTGSFVVLLSPNSPEWIIACLATIRAGAVPVP